MSDTLSLDAPRDVGGKVRTAPVAAERSVGASNFPCGHERAGHNIYRHGNVECRRCHNRRVRKHDVGPKRVASRAALKLRELGVTP